MYYFVVGMPSISMMKSLVDVSEPIPLLSVTSLTFDEKYFGLPTPDGGMSRGKLQNLQAQLIKCLLMWGDVHLAQAGREVFIKSVAQALPTYLMGVFKLPFSVCTDLTKLERNFY
jgi:hypothetical protein